MRHRRRNPSGLIEWAKLHPWMTFFLVPSVLMVPVYLVRALRPAPEPPPRDPLAVPTPPPVPRIVPPSEGGGTVFVPGVID